eukprot:gnl/MRDRNA2_/MRDRNA2_87168_c0_seq1.p1 gnl/MRDRNA2_/MRDRNA2_87168_c0~~gnl/MRDRNA2_/MRDRNA2_87168_c0_seq1.p1  ORF type:complete len:113 (+),score=46.01 gnl/MRDRNA2_/MRDRNA2_87168_c0_seq1:79-417(+)
MGWGKGGKGGIYDIMKMMMGKGKGKGKGKSLRDFYPEKKVWIGNLPDGVTYKELHEHMKASGAKWVEVMKGGNGGAGFSKAEEATAAIAALNGSDLKGNKIQVDVWTKKEKA